MNETKANNLSDTESATLVIRTLQNSVRPQQHKTTQADTKLTRAEIRTIHREATAEWMKPRIKSMVCSMRKKRKKNPKRKKPKRG